MQDWRIGGVQRELCERVEVSWTGVVRGKSEMGILGGGGGV